MSARARKARPRILPGADPAEVARSVLLFHYRRMRPLERVARRGVDPEGVHQMRVQTRRLRGMLRLFRRCLPPAVVERLRAQLKPLADALGAERDEDVLIALLESYLPRASAPEAAVLRAIASRRRAAKALAHRKLVAHLATLAYADLCASFEELETTPLPLVGRSAKRFARRSVHRRLRRVRARVKAASVDDPETLHALRVSVKNLRYAADALTDLLPPRSAPLARRAARVQDALGTVHDLDVAMALLARARPVPAVPGWGRAVQALVRRMVRDRKAAIAEARVAISRLLRPELDPG
jgi:CHAD domain-containing protein